MEKMNRLKDLQEKIEAMKADKDAILAQLEEKMTAYKADKTAAEKRMAAAIKGLDTDAYAAAEQDAKRVEVALRMYEKRKEQVQTPGECLPRAEADKLINDLLTAAAEAESQLLQKAQPLAAQLERMADEVAAATQLANRLLHIVQVDLCGMVDGLNVETQADGTTRGYLLRKYQEKDVYYTLHTAAQRILEKGETD